MVARGAKRARSELRGLLQAFQPLLLSWYGAGRAQDAARRPSGAAACRCRGGSALMCGFYLNELLLKLLAREDPHPQLYATYEQALARAGRRRRAGDAAAALRALAAGRAGLRADAGCARPTRARRSTRRPTTATRSIAARSARRRVERAARARWSGARRCWHSPRDATPMPRPPPQAKRLMRDILDHHLEAARGREPARRPGPPRAGRRWRAAMIDYNTGEQAK